MAFLREFARAPLDVGAVAPSGRELTAQAVRHVPRQGDPLVVELGPGTGAFTTAIQRRLGGRGRHLAVERNERFAGYVRERHPGVEVVTADARDLAQVLGGRRADAIVSGLPWSSFGAGTQRAILAAVAAGLTPGGTFTTFAYAYTRWTGPSRRFRRLIGDHFGEVAVGRTIWANLPPAYVYSGRRFS
ncbi:methyltransferase domain-containing protein [Actinoplanes sp. NPDC049596]